MTASTDTSTTASDDTSEQKTTSNATAAPALTLYGKMLTFTRIKLQTADLDDISTHLSTILSNKDSQIPVVIDSDVEQDLSALIDLFWSWGLQPIGVVTGVLDEAAKDLKLAIFPGDGKRIERVRPTKSAAAAPLHSSSSTSSSDTVTTTDSTVTEDTSIKDSHEEGSDQSTDVAEIELDTADGVTSMIYDQMLRSGQSINHVGGDLILTNSVNHGAEVITDNSLHIYGRAQGRLVAGATGDKDARIFCQRFNPSLVSVAGTYCTNDSIPKDVIDQAVQVSFKEGEGLVFEVMGNRSSS